MDSGELTGSKAIAAHTHLLHDDIIINQCKQTSLRRLFAPLILVKPGNRQMFFLHYFFNLPIVVQPQDCIIRIQRINTAACVLCINIDVTFTMNDVCLLFLIKLSRNSRLCTLRMEYDCTHIQYAVLKISCTCMTVPFLRYRAHYRVML